MIFRGKGQLSSTLFQTYLLSLHTHTHTHTHTHVLTHTHKLLFETWTKTNTSHNPLLSFAFSKVHVAYGLSPCQGVPCHLQNLPSSTVFSSDNKLKKKKNTNTHTHTHTHTLLQAANALWWCQNYSQIHIISQPCRELQCMSYITNHRPLLVRCCHWGTKCFFGLMHNIHVRQKQALGNLWAQVLTIWAVPLAGVKTRVKGEGCDWHDERSDRAYWTWHALILMVMTVMWYWWIC